MRAPMIGNNQNVHEKIAEPKEWWPLSLAGVTMMACLARSRLQASRQATGRPMGNEQAIHTTASKRTGLQAWMPQYRKLGYSREEAEDLVRIAETLWKRYTAAGLTIDSSEPEPRALEPFEVLVQAVCHFGLRGLFDDAFPITNRRNR